MKNNKQITQPLKPLQLKSKGKAYHIRKKKAQFKRQLRPPEHETQLIFPHNSIAYNKERNKN